MGKRGPAPKPTALKKLAGNPGKRRLNEREPAPTVGRPEMPRWLKGKAVTEWLHVAPILEQMGVLTQADQIGLALLADAVADYVELREKDKRRKGSNGTAVRQARADVLKLCREFGLTPSSRTSLQVAPQDSGDDWLNGLLGNAFGRS
jgi:P27 family predicted phage terminase small subunit